MISRRFALIALLTFFSLSAAGISTRGQDQNVTTGQKLQKATPVAAVAQQFGYITSRGSFLTRGSLGGEGLFCFRHQPSLDKFYKIQLQYVDYGQIGGFYGSYYSVTVGAFRLQLLFSDNVDTQGNYHVFYLDEQGNVLVDYAANRCPAN